MYFFDCTLLTVLLTCSCQDRVVSIVIPITLIVSFLTHKLCVSTFLLFIFYFLYYGFLLVTDLSQLTRLQLIICYVAGFCKLTISQSSTSHLQDYGICNNARLLFSTFFVLSVDQNKWCLKNGVNSMGV